MFEVGKIYSLNFMDYDVLCLTQDEDGATVCVIRSNETDVPVGDEYRTNWYHWYTPIDSGEKTNV